MHAKLLAATSALLIAPLSIAFATSVSQLVVFGDSLSDNGNAAIALATQNISLASLDYAPNAFTDGPNTTPKTSGPLGLWIDQFAAKLGVSDPQPYLANPITNTNYAVASGQTGTANPQDIGNQLTAFTVSHLGSAPSSALYTVWGGANDLYNGTASGKTAADTLYGNILTLSGEGAKNFLWLNLPNLALTPRGSTIAGIGSAAAAFDSEWTVDLASLKAQGVNVIGVDINTLFNQIIANRMAYGFADVMDPSQGKPVDPNTFLFWDTEHPTTAGDALIANLAYTDFVAPEPMSAGLSLLGLGAVLAAIKLRRKPTEV